MQISFNILAVSLLFVSQLGAVTTVRSFGTGTIAPVSITALDVIIGSNSSLAPDYLAQNSSNNGIRFRRHIDSDDNVATTDPCFYWFRSNGNPDQYLETESWDNVYWNAANPKCDYLLYDSYFDGAQSGSDNFVILTKYLGAAAAGATKEIWIQVTM